MLEYLGSDSWLPSPVWLVIHVCGFLGHDMQMFSKMSAAVFRFDVVWRQTNLPLPTKTYKFYYKYKDLKVMISFFEKVLTTSFVFSFRLLLFFIRFFACLVELCDLSLNFGIPVHVVGSRYSGVSFCKNFRKLDMVMNLGLRRHKCFE